MMFKGEKDENKQGYLIKQTEKIEKNRKCIILRKKTIRERGLRMIVTDA